MKKSKLNSCLLILVLALSVSNLANASLTLNSGSNPINSPKSFSKCQGLLEIASVLKNRFSLLTRSVLLPKLVEVKDLVADLTGENIVIHIVEPVGGHSGMQKINLTALRNSMIWGSVGVVGEVTAQRDSWIDVKQADGTQLRFDYDQISSEAYRGVWGIYIQVMDRN